MENKATTPKNGNPIDLQKINSTPKRCAFKIELCLYELLSRKNKGMNELEALSSYSDTCLHSSISTLANKHGLQFTRKPEAHNHRGGGKTIFTRYSITCPTSLIKALNLLNHYRNRRSEKLFCINSFSDFGDLVEQ